MTKLSNFLVSLQTIYWDYRYAPSSVSYIMAQLFIGQLWESVLSLHHMRVKDQTHVLRQGGENFYQLSHLKLLEILMTSFL